MSFPVMPFLLMAATAHAAAPVDPSDDFSPMMLAFSLLALLVLIVLVGIGIVLAALAAAMVAVLFSLGILSSAALVGLVRGRWSSVVRMILYQGLAVMGIPGGIGIWWLGTRCLHSSASPAQILLGGSLSGIVAGLLVAFLIDRTIVFLLRRFSPPGLPSTQVA